MEIAIWIGIGVLGAIAIIASLFLRRQVLAGGGGTIEVSMRLSTFVVGRGWAPGFARFERDAFLWYRMFSLWLGPRRTLFRKGLRVMGRRVPEGPERLVLPEGWVILRCASHPAPVEIAMAESAVTGFLSWLEAAPPGAASTRLAA
jgi:hypothetical protein